MMNLYSNIPLKMIANFAITYSCNGRCKTCEIWKIPNPGEDILTLKEIDDFFNGNAIFLRDVNSIQLTGGEPFLREDLCEIIETIHKIIPDCFIWIPTNGLSPSLINAQTQKILRKMEGISMGISVSVDGIGRVHDEQRGVTGAYSNALETLKKLCNLRIKFQGLKLSIGMTLTPLNFNQIFSVYNLSKIFEVDFSTRPVNFSDIYYRNKWRFNLNRYLDSIIPMLRRIARELIVEKGFYSTASTLYFLKGVIDYIRNPSLRTLFCHAASESIFIDPYGNVYPCILMDTKLGNIRQQSLEEILSSKEAINARIRVSKLDCPCCWVECEVYREINHDFSGLFKTIFKAFINRNTLGLV